MEKFELYYRLGQNKIQALMNRTAILLPLYENGLIGSYTVVIYQDDTGFNLLFVHEEIQIKFQHVSTFETMEMQIGYFIKDEEEKGKVKKKDGDDIPF